MTDSKADWKKINKLLLPFLDDGLKELEEKGNKFVHYTSAENAINILRSKTLWMRSANCMNDYMEIQYGHNKLKEYFEKNNNKYQKKLSCYDADLHNEIITQFNAWWEQVRFNTFITSISVHHKEEDKNGRLSMWRAYGNSNASAALVLNNPGEVAGLGVILCPALYYENTELETELDKILENFENNIKFLKTQKREVIKSSIFISLLILAVSLKHPGFKEEQEWRVIYIPKFPQKNNLIENDVEVISGIPQIVYKLPLENTPDESVNNMSLNELVNKIIIGPTKYPTTVPEALTIEMKNAEINNPKDKISVSEIPLRT